MPTVAKTFAFATTAEGYVATAGPATTMSYDAAVGNPAGSLKTRTAGRNKADANYWEWTGTWEALGVPAGTVVTGLQLSGCSTRCSEYNVAQPSTIGPYELRDSLGVLLGTLWAGRSVSAASVSWTATGAQPAVTFAAQPSSTTVRIRLADTLATGSNNAAAVTVYDDQVALTVTYAVPAKVGTGFGSWGFTGSVVGARASRGAGSGSWGFAGVATGQAPAGAPATGSGVGSFAYTGSAAGQAPALTAADGAASGVFAFTGTATGRTSRRGAATGGLVYTGTATGTTVKRGTGTGSVTWASTTTGATTKRGAASGLTTWAGSASGTAPAPDAKQGTASGSWLYTGTATGATPTVTTSAGVAAGSWAFTGATTALVVYGHGDTPPERTRVVAVETRRRHIETATRLRAVAAETRTRVMPADPRARGIPAEPPTRSAP